MNPVEIMARALLAHDFGNDSEPDRWGHLMVEYRVQAQAALTALAAQGYAVVPLEATDAMIAAAEPHTQFCDNFSPVVTWRAMIAAATAEREVV